MLNLPQNSYSAPTTLHSSAIVPFCGDGSGTTPTHDGAGKIEATDRQPKVLLVGDHPTLQYTRCKLLEAAGYAVTSARSDVIVEELFLRGIEVVLLCHTIPEDAAMRIVSAFARLAPQIAVLRISAIDSPFVNKATSPIVSARPGELLSAVAATLSHH